MMWTIELPCAADLHLFKTSFLKSFLLTCNSFVPRPRAGQCLRSLSVVSYLANYKEPCKRCRSTRFALACVAGGIRTRASGGGAATLPCGRERRSREWNWTLHQSSHGFAIKTKALAPEIPPRLDLRTSLRLCEMCLIWVHTSFSASTTSSSLSFTIWKNKT